MIQIYKKGNTDFVYNGESVLTPEKCTLNAKLNDAWEMTLIHPLDEGERWKHIKEEAVICAPTFMGEEQLFRIYDVEKTEEEVIAKARPIFFDSAKDCFLMDVRPDGKNGQQALSIMMAGSKYQGESDITTGSTAYFVRRNLMDALNGEDSPTFVQRWGGEILYDNYKVIINERAGSDRGTEVRYGKNIKGASYHVDMSEVVTRIIPIAYNGRGMSGKEPWVDSAEISKYATVYTKEMKFDNIKLKSDASGESEGDIICKNQAELDARLTAACRKQYEAGVDKPKISINISLADLKGTEEYKEFEHLETIGLGDTVHCYHQVLDITTEARAVEIEWDCIQNVCSSVILGEYEYDYFSELTSTLEAVNKVLGPENTIMAERVSGVLNAINTQLRYQKNIAQKQDVRAILFEDIDPASFSYGAMCLGTQGFQIADKRLQDDSDWDWSTAFTAKGGYADVLITGIISDKTGRNFWNLDTGEFQLSSTQTIVDGQPLGSYLEGVKAFAIRLSNDFQSIPTDYLGNYKVFPEVSTIVYVNFGKDDISSQCTYKVTQSKGVTGNWDNEKRMYTMTGLTEDSGYVDIEATYLGMFKATKRFNANKQKSGMPGIQGIQGEQGEQGIPGPPGEDGIPGPPGNDGADGKTSYTHIAYANSADGRKDFSTSDSNREYIGMYVDFEAADSTMPEKYAWSKIKGADGSNGIPGKPGADGKTPYLHIAYANSADGAKDFSVSDSNREYIGQYTDFTQTDSANPAKYSWSKIKGDKGEQGLQGLQGEKGDQGIPGKNGSDGKTSYFHIKYSSVANPASSSQMTETPNTYIGTYVDFIQADSTDPKRYSWSRFEGIQGSKGDQGIPGKNGTNGQTSYLHIKYSNDGGKTFTANTGETPGDYIGQYVDFVQADSTDPKRYSWSKTKGETGRTYFIELSANILKRKQNNRILPISVSAKAFYRDGTSAARTAYAGRWKVETSTNGVDYTTVVSSTADESSKSYRVETLAANIVSVRFTLYAAGGLTTPLDMQSIPIVIDVDNLTHEQIFNLLTNNGAMKGIYQSGGQLYINGTYIRSLIITADMIQGKSVTADKINVEELSSIGATIGGFKVNQEAIYAQNYGSSIKNLELRSSRGILDKKSFLMFRGATGNISLREDGIVGNNGTVLRLYPTVDTGSGLGDGSHHNMGSTSFSGTVTVSGALKVSGTKSVTRKTKHYGEQDFYCYEMPTPILGDVGSGTIGEDGKCYVDNCDILQEAANTEVAYFVFLQKEGKGDLWISQKTPTYFVVEGTPGLSFAWEVKIKQTGYEYLRYNNDACDTNVGFRETDYLAQMEQEIETLHEDMEEIVL